MYRTICTQLWTDPKVRALTVQGKLLFVYAITNPHTHLSGMYYLPMELLKKETGLSDTLSHTLFDTLSQSGLLHRDDHTETIFVTNMFRYQGKGAKNEQAAANHLLTLHQSSLIHHFFAVYPSVKQYWKGYPIDTLSDRGTEANKRCPSVPAPVLLTNLPPNPNLQSNPKTKTNGLTPFPVDWVVDEKMKTIAEGFGLQGAAEFQAFKDHALMHDRRLHDWMAGYRSWIRKGKALKETRR